jgi:hypothetical protein
MAVRKRKRSVLPVPLISPKTNLPQINAYGGISSRASNKPDWDRKMITDTDALMDEEAPDKAAVSTELALERVRPKKSLKAPRILYLQSGHRNGHRNGRLQAVFLGAEERPNAGTTGHNDQTRVRCHKWQP